MAAGEGRSAQVQTVAPERSVRVTYAWPTDQRVSAVRARLPLYDDGSALDVNDLVNVLVEDKVNLRNVNDIRYWHRNDEVCFVFVIMMLVLYCLYFWFLFFSVA